MPHSHFKLGIVLWPGVLHGANQNEASQQPAFSPFPQCFLPFPNQFVILHSHLFCRLQMLSVKTSLRFCCLVELTLSQKSPGIHVPTVEVV